VTQETPVAAAVAVAVAKAKAVVIAKAMAMAVGRLYLIILSSSWPFINL
jgi:hypothetical protein